MKQNKLTKYFKKWFFILFIIHLVYVVLLKWIFPPITITQINSMLFDDATFKREYVSADEISKEIKLAVIAAEDQKFPYHIGIDFESVKKVLNKTKNNNFSRGASTISQQTAKNVFLWQGRSWIRKGLEAYFTLLIELVWGKERILEVYLNCIEMDTGVYGIKAAAQHYFKKSAINLTKREASLIAATLPNPNKYTIIPLSGYISRQSAWIKRQMYNLQSDEKVKNLILNQ